MDTNTTCHAEDSLDSVRNHMEGTSEVSKSTLDSPHTDALTQKPESSIWQPYFEAKPPSHSRWSCGIAGVAGCQGELNAGCVQLRLLCGPCHVSERLISSGGMC